MKALVLSGGGSKGAFQIGVLRQLVDRESADYDIYAGISVGALNAAMLSTGSTDETVDQLEDIWFNKIKGNHSVWRHNLWRYILGGIILILLFTIAAFVSFILTAPKWVTILLGLCTLASFYWPYYSLTHTHSIYSTDPLRHMLKKHLDTNRIKTSGKKLRVGVVSFTTGEYRSVTEEQDNIVDWIVASSAFPIFFPMQHIENEYWTDGGVTDVAPLTDAIKMGATEIDVILASPLDAGYYWGQPSIIKQMMRNVEIMSSEILRNDLHARCSMAKDVKIRIFLPDKPLTSNPLEFDPEKIKRMYDIGKKVANDVLDKS